ncbi:hypothetical protein B0H14DRAFT_2986838, partial [Mycena olivaceomarginata]
MGCGFARADTGFWMVDIVIGTPRFTIFLLSALVSPLSFFHSSCTCTAASCLALAFIHRPRRARFRARGGRRTE